MKNKVLVFVLTLAVLVFCAACSKENEEITSSLSSSTEIEITPVLPESTSSEAESSESESESTSSEENSASVSETEQEQSSAPDEPYKGTKDYGLLILVNAKNYIPEDYTVELEQVQGKYNMDIRAAAAARELVAAAAKAGFNMQLCSAYRTVEKSAQLYANQVQKFLNAGYDQATAEKEAAKWVAPPGTSEHHTGLAMDLVSSDYWGYYSDLEHDYENFDSFKWLYANCAEYGFILRYPKDKQEVTGITYEPWHYRYVGKEAAKYIMEKGLCLEEYLEEINS